ncbi:MAG: DUF3987 domain-containing protein [Chromatiales bacterium]|nr:DUF3987 domain-containing protein [Chromatiales bacterium]
MRADDRDLWVRDGAGAQALGRPRPCAMAGVEPDIREVRPEGRGARHGSRSSPRAPGPAAVFAEAQRAGWVNPAKRERKTTETPPPGRAEEGERHTHQTTGERGEEGENPSGARAGTGNEGQRDYPAPAPLPKLPPVPEIPLEILPNDLRGWVEDAAERARFRPDFAAVAAMSALGSVIGRQVGIRLKQHDDWTEYANVWGCVIGPPSALKSPAIQQALKPFKWLQVAADERHQSEMQGYKQDMEDFELRKKLAKKNAEKALTKDPLAAVARDTTPPPEKPPERTYWTSNATAEALGVKLAENPVGLFLERDELSSLLVELEDERNATARGLYLSGWSGREGYRFDRIMRGTTYIPKFALSVFGGIQPGPLARYVRGASSGERADGLLQRFQLAVWPDPARFEYVDRHPSQAARERARLLFERADNLDAEAIGYHDQFGEDPPYVRLSPEAQGLFVEWYTDFMRHRRQVEAEGAESDPICAHFGKYPGLVGKLALILHVADASRRARGLRDHALEGAGVAGLSDPARAAHLSRRRASRRPAPPSLLLARDSAGRAAREVHRARHLPPVAGMGWPTRSAVLRACDLLQEYDWLIDVSPEWKGTGRPPAKLYAVSPAVEVAAMTAPRPRLWVVSVQAAGGLSAILEVFPFHSLSVEVSP